MATERPFVSVLMPVYNGGDRLAPAIRSVLQQHYHDLELIVVDDGSSDGSSQLIEQFRAEDDRIRVVTHSTNRGLVASLNDGLDACRGELVARLDADDIAYRTRLERQVGAFTADPDLVLSATSYRRVDPAGTTIRIGRPPVLHAAFAAAMLTGNRLCHSTVMFRRDAAIGLGGYREEWFPVEDYDLWLRLARVGKYVALTTEEVVYLDNPSGISSTRAVEQLRRHRERAGLEVAGWSDRQHAGQRSARVRVSSLARARRRMESDLTGRGIPTTGLSGAVHAAMLTQLADKSWLGRHATILVAAPSVAVRALIARQFGQRDR